MTPIQDETRRLLREAMDRYGLTDADAGHVTDGRLCWCAPARVCAECLTSEPCLHGVARTEVVLHRKAS